MDQLLPPFMQRNPVWPSTFPKVLSVLGIIVGLIVLFGLEGATEEKRTFAADINYRRLHEYKLGQALMLLALMVAYALMLRPRGSCCHDGVPDGRKRHPGRAEVADPMLLVAALATGCVWYLVQEVLGIFLRPFPFFMGV
jgi:putative tricarboxylic transport membrane protein